jgi:hypothetical protein
MTKFPPTPEQAAIIDAVERGESIIVNALAGAAKSTTIEMAAFKVKPGNNIALAFNKKIAEELTPRLPFPAKTINALGFAAWRRTCSGKKIELVSDKVNIIRKRLDEKSPYEVTRVVSMAKLNGLVPRKWTHLGKGILSDEPHNWDDLADDLDMHLQYDDPLTKERVDLLPLCRQMLEESIKEAYAGIMDFDDQVYMPTCFGGLFEKYDFLAVDEAQDLSPLNHLMLKRIKPKQLVVVGDPLQSIYAFRGADTSSMPKLQADWDLKEYTLSVCFRCSKKVGAFARNWAPNLKSPDWAPEGKVLTEFELTNNWEKGGWNFSMLPDNITVICRNNAPLVKLALKIARRMPIGFVNGKMKDQMLSQLRQICNYKKTLSASDVKAKIETWLRTKCEQEDPKKHERYIDSAEALMYCCDGATSYDAIERTITGLFQNPKARILFATGHASKGLEWENVLHLDPWRLPSKYAKSPEAIQQELNIQYVISTRAKLNLYHASLDSYEEVK